MIIFCAVLIWGNFASLKLTIFNFALTQLAAYFITFLVCLFFSLQLTNKLSFNFNAQQFKTIAKATLPYAVVYFLMTTYYRIDGVMLEKLQGANGAYETGIYAQGYRIMESLNNIGYLLANILLPLFAYRIANKLDVKPILKSGFNIIFCIAVSLLSVYFIIVLKLWIHCINLPIRFILLMFSVICCWIFSGCVVICYWYIVDSQPEF